MLNKTTVANKLREGKYEDLIEMTIFTCNCKKIELPLRYYDPTIDGTLDEYCADWLLHEYIEDYAQIQIVDNKLVVIEEPDCKCEECKLGKTYVKDMPILSSFNGMEFNHGIIAYQRDNTDLLGAKQHLNKVLNDSSYATCCSTECIGNIGAILVGDVRVASNCDLGSGVDSNGRYYNTNSKDAEYLITTKEEMTYGVDGMNDEFITTNNNIRGIWYKEHASNVEKAFARDLAIYYDVKLIEVPMTEADIEDMKYMERYM